MLCRVLSCMFIVSFVIGCVPNGPAEPLAQESTVAAAPAPGDPGESQATPDASSTVVAEPPANTTEPPAQFTPATEPPFTPPSNGEAPPTERVAATAGVGIQGQSLQNESGLFVQAAKSFFSVKQRLVFENEIPKAMQLFQATEGRFPQTHDEFMAKIITMNQIQLPKLPEGHQYRYDPQQSQLMVERPAK